MKMVLKRDHRSGSGSRPHCPWPAWLLSLALISALLGAAACHKSSGVPNIPAQPSSPGTNYLNQGNDSFAAGDYGGAAQAYEQFLQEHPESKEQEKVLFRIGLAYAIPGSRTHDLQRAIGVFKRLLELFPDGSYKAELGVILALYSDVEKRRLDLAAREEQIKVLRNELEKLKQIDLQRRPSRTPP